MNLADPTSPHDLGPEFDLPALLASPWVRILIITALALGLWLLA